MICSGDEGGALLDEIADKETVMHTVGNLYAKHIERHAHKFLVLEGQGDAKSFRCTNCTVKVYPAVLLPLPMKREHTCNYISH